MSHFTDDCTFATARGPEPWGPQVTGKENIGNYLAARFEVIPDMNREHDYQYLCRDRAVSVWRVTGKSGSGELLNYKGCDLWEFRDGNDY